MKKIILFTCITLLLSCSTTKSVRETKSNLKGNWQLQDISYNQTGPFTIKLLQDASPSCFEGSSWQFIPNNNTGNYLFRTSDCSQEKRFFVFTIEENANSGGQDFLLKPTNAKQKSESNNSGFRFQITQVTETKLVLEQTVNVDGTPFTINMNFSKTSK